MPINNLEVSRCFELRDIKFEFPARQFGRNNAGKLPHTRICTYVLVEECSAHRAVSIRFSIHEESSTHAAGELGLGSLSVDLILSHWCL